MDNRNFSITNKIVLITGANRGIGHALLEEALRRGAKKVYAGTRKPFAHIDQRVVPLTLDVTNKQQIAEALTKVDHLDVLINNAGVSIFDDLSDHTMINQHFAVNFFGPYDMVQAFLPLLVRAKGAIINNLSLAALAALPPVPSYSISKAATFSMTQSLRTFLKTRGVSVHAVLTGPTDTDMSREFQIPKTSPDIVAQAIYDGVENNEEDIFPDVLSKSLAQGWNNGIGKALEKQNAALT
jgi:NAD(P)-dependent dehydrogenase (short-subunit alcohol dehydrogenase family)